MDTVGNVIDKLFTVNLKMQHNPNSPKLVNLNVQKDLLKNEIDNSMLDIFKNDKKDDEIIRPQHKTY